jgi:hypothetical protein
MILRPMNLNSNTYPAMDGSTTAQRIELNADDTASCDAVDIVNSSTYDIFVMSGSGVETTAAFPSDTPLPGAVIPAGGRGTFTKEKAHDYISAVSKGIDGLVYIKVGNGV